LAAVRRLNFPAGAAANASPAAPQPHQLVELNSPELLWRRGFGLALALLHGAAGGWAGRGQEALEQQRNQRRPDSWRWQRRGSNWAGQGRRCWGASNSKLRPRQPTKPPGSKGPPGGLRPAAWRPEEPGLAGARLAPLAGTSRKASRQAGGQAWQARRRALPSHNAWIEALEGVGCALESVAGMIRVQGMPVKRVAPRRLLRSMRRASAQPSSP